MRTTSSDSRRRSAGLECGSLALAMMDLQSTNRHSIGLEPRTCPRAENFRLETPLGVLGHPEAPLAASHRTEREDPPSPPALLFVVCGAMRTRALRTVEPSRTAPNTACRTRGHAVLPRWSWHPIFARVPGGALCDLCVVSLARAVLRRCLAALIEHRLKRRSGDTAELDELQTDAPLIAEVEHIRDRLADIEA